MGVVELFRALFRTRNYIPSRPFFACRFSPSADGYWRLPQHCEQNEKLKHLSELKGPVSTVIVFNLFIVVLYLGSIVLLKKNINQ